MKIIIVKNYQELSDEANKVMRKVLMENERPVLGLATGSSPIGLYQAMVKDYLAKLTDYQKVVTFNLDEYVGIPEDHPESYATFMKNNLFSKVNIKMENVHLPKGNNKDESLSIEYEKDLAKYQVDIQLLGVGSNGHIGFNEPNTSFDSVTHVVELNESTRKDNARFFNNDISLVPTHARSMGLATIMKAKKILLIASSTNKAEAVNRMINGPITEECPASLLQKHPDVTVILDHDAASLL